MIPTALAGLCLGAALVGMAYLTAWWPGGAPAWSVWPMILGCALLMGSPMLLGAARSGVPTRWAWGVAGFVTTLILVGVGAATLLPPEHVAGRFVLGLPLRAAIEIFGVALLPVAVLPFVYARFFRAHALDERALAELRERCAKLRRET